MILSLLVYAVNNRLCSECMDDAIDKFQALGNFVHGITSTSPMHDDDPDPTQIRKQMNYMHAKMMNFFQERSKSISKFDAIREKEYQQFDKIYVNTEKTFLNAANKDILMSHSNFVEAASQFALLAATTGRLSLLLALSTYRPRIWLTYIQGWFPIDKTPIQGIDQYASINVLYVFLNSEIHFNKLFNLFRQTDDKLRFIKMVLTTNYPAVQFIFKVISKYLQMDGVVDLIELQIKYQLVYDYNPDVFKILRSLHMKCDPSWQFFNNLDSLTISKHRNYPLDVYSYIFMSIKGINNNLEIKEMVIKTTIGANDCYSLNYLNENKYKFNINNKLFLTGLHYSLTHVDQCLAEFINLIKNKNIRMKQHGQLLLEMVKNERILDLLMVDIYSFFTEFDSNELRQLKAMDGVLRTWVPKWQFNKNKLKRVIVVINARMGMNTDDMFIDYAVALEVEFDKLSDAAYEMKIREIQKINGIH